jgi:hypothetical protein
MQRRKPSTEEVAERIELCRSVLLRPGVHMILCRLILAVCVTVVALGADWWRLGDRLTAKT